MSPTLPLLELSSQPVALKYHALSWRASGFGLRGLGFNIGALMITNAILGVPYYNYGILNPQTLF